MREKIVEMFRKWPVILGGGIVLGAMIVLGIRFVSYAPPKETHYHANFALYVYPE
jgi:hypothetical protein